MHFGQIFTRVTALVKGEADVVATMADGALLSDPAARGFVNAARNLSDETPARRLSRATRPSLRGWPART